MSREKEDKKFTWRDLKKAINKIPDQHLDKPIYGWKMDDDGGYLIEDIEILGEDYLYDGVEGCCPRSQMQECLKEEKADYPGTESEYHVVHKKGTRVLHIGEL